MNIFLALSAVLVYPLFYFVLYLPIIVPRLQQGSSLPWWVVLPHIIAAIFLVLLGVRLAPNKLFGYAIGITVSFEGYLFWMALLQMPGFRKTEIHSVKLVLLSASIVLVLVTTGLAIGYMMRHVLEWRRRRYASG